MLYVEGKPDRILALKLTGLPGSEILRERNKSEVLKRLVEQSNCLAIVDEDPGHSPPSYLDRMQVATNLSNLGFRVLEHRAQGNRVILLCPRIEEWIIQAAEDSDLRLDYRRYNLPHNAVQLHQVINFDLRKLERLIDDLMQSGAPRIRQLSNLLAG